VQANKFLSPADKLKKLYPLKNKFETAHQPFDSAYANILFLIGKNEISGNKNYNIAIAYTLLALHINKQQKIGSLNNAADDALHLAHYYNELDIYDKALVYYDTTISLSSKFFSNSDIAYAKLSKAHIFLDKGDYEKCIEESTKGLNFEIQNKDSSYYFGILNQRAYAFFMQNHLKEALTDLETIIRYTAVNDPFNYVSALQTKANVYAKLKDFSAAELLFRQTIKASLKTADNTQISAEYISFGSFYQDNLYKYSNARECYLKAIEYAKKDKNDEMISIANTDIGEVCYDEHQYAAAEMYDNAALQILKINTGENKFANPAASQLNLIGFKELVIEIMANKTKLFLQLNKETGDKNYLTACLKTALVTDSVITETRHEQMGEQSKLFWRDKTRTFFQNVIEAAYRANDAEKVFYFMEKSRAVLLDDKLNELGAAAYIPDLEAVKEESFQTNIIDQEQQLSALNQNSKEYAALQIKLLNAKDDFEHYTKSLEQKYPAYYQYKYADNVPSLQDLQSYLAARGQSFVHYFMNDTLAYILAITPQNAKIISLSSKEFDSKKLIDFLRFCSDKQRLNNHYDSFALASHLLYQLLFQPLQLPKGRIVICPDNFLIPFEALCTDKNGKQFLINDYAFSYVYSARYLMKAFINANAKGNFLGIAPVNFSASLDVPDLSGADDALQKSASHYSNSRLLTHEDASHGNFMSLAADYSVVNIFSHARADSANEPLLFMQDSVIHLSELQLLNNPATQLIVLSACQTNVGKNATGEGIYSLARGFAAAGIPSVAATLWKADDQTIYAISEKFHEYLSQGIPKDEALQKAKLLFMQNNDGEKLLPYFWANMVLAGNAEPIKLSAKVNEWWWIVFTCVLLATLTFFMLRKTRKPAAK
jgi:CHAT domain-containing protein